MRPTEQQLQQWATELHHWNCRVRDVKHAAASSQTWNHNHPDNIKKQIRELKALLVEAGI